MGRRRNTRKGLIVGAAFGAAVVAAIALIPKDSFCPPGEPSTESCLSDRTAFLALSIPSYALAGAGIGALIKSDRWSPVPLENVRISLAPTRGHGLGLSLSLRF